MTRAVYIRCQSVLSMLPQGSAGTRAIDIELSMTDAQVRAAVVYMLSEMTDAELAAFLVAEFGAALGVA